MKSMDKLNPKFFCLRLQGVLCFSVRFLNVLFYIGAYILSYEFFSGKLPFFAGVLCIVAVYIVSALVYYFIRYIFSIIFFYLFVYCVAFIMVLTGDTVDCALLPVLALLVTVSAISSIIDCKKGYPHYLYSFNWVRLTVPVIMLFYAVYSHSDKFYILAFLFALIFFIGHFWCTYLNGMTKFMSENINLANVPRNDIYKGNTRVVLVILIIFMAVAGFVFMFRYMNLFMGIGSAISRAVITFINRFIKLLMFIRGISEPEEETEVGEGTTEMQYDDSNSSELLLNILGIIGALILLAVVVLWIIALIKRPRKPKRMLNIVYGTYEDDVEEIKPKEKIKRHFFKDNNEKVRYRFKRFIKKNLKPNVPRGKTACELSVIAMHNLHSDVKALDKDDFKEDDYAASGDDVRYEKLTSLYNVARYSGRMVTNDEIKELSR